MKTKILLLGLSSHVGLNLYYSLCNKEKYDILALTRDINNFKKINNVKKFDENILIEIFSEFAPNVVINCVSNGDIDFCEKNEELSKYINIDLALKILKLCNSYNSKLISFSSSMVYDGSNSRYDEKSNFNPLNVYGKQKVYVDTKIREYIDKHIILRPTTILTKKEIFQRHNPVSFINEKILNNEDIYLVNDVKTNFIYVKDLIKVVKYFIENNIVGEFNISGDETLTRFELGLIILKRFFNSSTKISPCTSDKFPTLAKRPHNIILDNSKIKSIMHIKFSHVDDYIDDIITKD